MADVVVEEKPKLEKEVNQVSTGKNYPNFFQIYIFSNVSP